MSGAGTEYRLWGLRLAIEASDPLAASILHRRLGRFPQAGGPSQLRFRFVGVAGSHDHGVQRPKGKLREIYELPGGEAVHHTDEDRFYLSLGERVRALCTPSRGQAVFSFDRSHPESVWLACHPLFTLCFIEALKRRQRYAVHAAGVSVQDKAILFAGNSGAGKSTIALALLRAGFGFLGDDMCFLERRADGWRVLGFPDEIDVAEETVEMFPELAFLLDRPVPPGRRKRGLDPEEVYSVRVVSESRPGAIVLPRVGVEDRSRLERISPGEALLELAPNVLLTEVSSSQAHLDALGELVRHSSCYRLNTGRDLDALPDLLGGLA